MLTGARPRVIRSSSISSGRGGSNPDPRPCRPMAGLRRQDGVTTSETLVVAGLVVSIVIGTMFIFRGKMTGAVTTLGNCIARAAAGDFSGCRGGGTAGPQQAAANPNAIPGMRTGGVAGGLVMTSPGGPGKGVGGTLAPGKASANLSGVPNPIPTAVQNQMRDRFTRIIKIATPLNQGVESKWETTARLWNRATGGGAIENAMDNQEALGDRAWNHGMQSMRDARQKFDAGNVDGFNAAIRDAQKWFGAAGRNYSASNSTKADLCEQAATEAQFIADTSRQVNTALAAGANPVGFATGLVVGTGVQAVAEATLPPGMGRDVLVGVTTGVATIYAGGAMGTPQLLGARVLTSTEQQVIGWINTTANAAQTGAQKGAEAGIKEIAVALIVEGITRAPVFRPVDANSPRLSLNDVLATTGEKHGNAIKDFFANPQAQNAAAQHGQAVADDINKPANADALEQAAQGQSHTAKNDGGKPAQELPPPSDDFKTKLDSTPRPVLTDEQKRTFHEGGMNEDAGADLLHAAQVTGETEAYRAGNLDASNQMQAGTAEGKPKGVKANSSDELRGAIPFDQADSKNGTAVRNAEADLAQATAAGDSSKIKQATDRLDQANRNLEAAQDHVVEAIVKGYAEPKYVPELGAIVLVNPTTKKVLVSDHDKLATTAVKNGDPIHDYGEYGQGSQAQAQNLANQRHALGDSATSHQHLEQSTSPPELKLPLSDRILVIGPEGPQIIKGRTNIVDFVRSRGMKEGDNWHLEGGRPALGQGTQHGAAIAAGAQAAHDLNEREAVARKAQPPANVATRQAFLEGTRLQGQKQYAIDARNVAATQAATPPDPVSMARQQQVNAAVPKDRAQTAVAQQQVSDAVATQRHATDGALKQPTPQSATTLGQANQRLRNVVQERTTERDEADAAVSQTFGTPRAATLPGVQPSPGGMTLDRTQPPSSFLARLTDRVISETATTRGPVLAIWLAPVDDPRVPGRPGRVGVSQSMVHERVHAHASPAWRSEFERPTALHEGVSQYFTGIALSRVATPQTLAYPAFAAQTEVASRIALMVSPGTLATAYFHGDTIGLHRTMGQRMGAATPQEAVVWGRALFQRIGPAMNEGRNAEVIQILARFAGTPPGASAVPAPAPPPQAGSAARSR